MAVGRTVWDFLWEVMSNPRFGLMLLAMLILLEIAFLVMASLINEGYLTLRLNFGGLEVEIHPLAIMLFAQSLKPTYNHLENP